VETKQAYILGGQSRKVLLEACERTLYIEALFSYTPGTVVERIHAILTNKPEKGI